MAAVSPSKALTGAGADPVLTDIESEALAAVRELGVAGAAEVREEFLRRGRDVPYTTMSSVLQRLYRRGLLTRGKQRVRGGQRYTFEVSEKGPALIEAFLNRITDAFGEKAYVRLFEAMGAPSADEIGRLKQKLKEG